MRTYGALDRSKVEILDLGCGQGASLWFLLREGFAASGCDGSIDALQKASRRVYADDLQPQELALCDLTDLPFKDESFDAVVDVVSAAHNPLLDMCCIFGEIYRVLKPGGRIFSMLPTNESSREPFKPFAVSFLNMVQVDVLLASNGFDDREILPYSYHASPGCRVEHWVVTARRRERTS